MAGTNPISRENTALHVFNQNICEGKSRRTNAKRDFQFIDNSLLEKCQNKRTTMRQPDGFIEVIEVGEIFFDVLRALIRQYFELVSSSKSSYLKSYLSADVITTNRSLYKS